MKRFFNSLLIVIVLFAFIACNGNVDEKLWKRKQHNHVYAIQSDGAWRCTICNELLAGTDKSYATLVKNGQPTQIILLTSGTNADIGAGKIVVTGTDVNYTNSSTDTQDVVIRTNLFGFHIAVNGSQNDTVRHYGYAGLVEIKKVAMSSYDEFGVVGRLFATDSGALGHIKVKSGATVYQIEQLGGSSTKVTVDPNATVYDINHEKVLSTDSIVANNQRFTTTEVITVTTSNTNGERITAKNCVHDHTEDIIDNEHVYEVCKTCGYTVIKVVSNKKTVATVNDENVIIPKATYDASQVANSSNTATDGDVQININSQTGEYVTPSIEETPIVDQTKLVRNCSHTFDDGVEDGTAQGTVAGKRIYTCTKCGTQYSIPYYEGPQSLYWIEKAASTFAGGSGSEQDPYQISKAQELALLAKIVNGYDSNKNPAEYADKYYVQTANIDLSGKVWTPIGIGTENAGGGDANGFKGHYDGGSYSISGLTNLDKGNAVGFKFVSSVLTATDMTVGYGLFGVVKDASFKNIVIKKASVSSSDFQMSSLIVGISHNSISMIDCSTDTESVFSVKKKSGGLIGFITLDDVATQQNPKYVTLTNCSNAATISGTGDRIGGIIGAMTPITTVASAGSNYIIKINNCDNSGKITASSRTGAIIAHIYNFSDSIGVLADHEILIKDCDNTGTLIGTKKGMIGYCVGTWDGNYLNFVNCTYAGSALTVSNIAEDYNDVNCCKIDGETVINGSV